MTQNKRTVLAIKTMAKEGWAALAARPDVDAISFAPDTKPAEFRALLASRPRIDAMILGMTPISTPELAAASGLAVVARIGVGYDAIDVPALTRAGIPLMITGTANSPSVAEHAFSFILSLAKRGPGLDRMVRERRWMDRLSDQPVDLVGKTLLVIGFGRIGSRLVRRALAFEMAVMVYDPYVPGDVIRSAGASSVANLDEALAAADFVSIHCPRNSETENLIDAARLSAMKPTAFLINTARGGIVDEVALDAALRTGRLAGAGLDVLAAEPPPSDHPLLGNDRVILAPHMAGVSKEAFTRMAEQAVANVLSVFDGAVRRENVVNPEVLR
jgi:D-3-phosphoglycerate dehydrogenase